MKNRKKYDKKPMLYITQPNLEKPSASMQSSYRTPKKKKEQNSKEKPLKVKKKLPKTRAVGKDDQNGKHESEKSVVDGLLKQDKLEAKGATDESKPKHQQEEMESSDEVESEESSNSTNRNQTKRKRFTDMTIDEKVNYFIGLPSSVPRMKCEVITKEERHRGAITDCQEGIVHMVTVKRPRNKEVDIKDIINIRLIGF